ncbi:MULTISPECIES: fluoride efflux transporter FluC [Actinoalloteichus]|uniref:Fluoride-specific ion channel FluC n=1 Tax=Actinoalloteichus fjordicus TaxID=1612552 RepID=A0AAC9L7Z8_9PSEU|nr:MULTISPECIES: CrcB family protein [Actinoalloteichus]APU12491.1 putative membrane protein [Actinoalloteichus fjordicus]APU18444.1 putative membrane protein [Actinoalloteichus sp. GBA129-24]
MTVLLVALAGAAGAVLRHLVHVLLPADRPGVAWPTLIVNGVGTLLLTLIGALSTTATNGAVLGIGFCGALTTYSTFAAQTVALAEQGHRFLAAANIGLNLLVGAVAVLIGTLLGGFLG